MNELRAIPGFEGLYSVTADGRVWSHEKRRVMPTGGVRIYAARWLKGAHDGRGYVMARLCRDGKVIALKVHRLVAFAWIPNPLQLPSVNHRDGDKSNNAADNLEWCTTSTNTKHAWDTGLRTSSDWHKENMRRAQSIGVEKKRQAKVTAAFN